LPQEGLFRHDVALKFTLINKTFYIDIILCRIRAKEMTKEKSSKMETISGEEIKRKGKNSYKFHFASSTVVL